MSRFPEFLAVALLAAGPAFAGDFGLGRPATEAEVAAWDIDVRPDGEGLPEGSGSVAEGEEIFVEQCAVCHGDFGEGVDRWPVLAGGDGTLASDNPVKTVGSYWPYASTVYDYVHRAMPFGNAQSLSPDEVYALTAYILYLNYVVEDEEFVLSNENFGDIEMPNVGGFIFDERPDTPYLAQGAPCMSDCKDEVKITARAMVLDVTPDDETNPGGELVVVETPVEPEPEPEAAPAHDPELVAEGETVFRKCSACHMVGEGAKHRVGPTLNGVVGSPAGQADGFKYSGALTSMAEGGLVWDEEALAAFLRKPREFMKGTKMAFAGLKDEADIAAVIAYLAAQE